MPLTDAVHLLWMVPVIQGTTSSTVSKASGDLMDASWALNHVAAKRALADGAAVNTTNDVRCVCCVSKTCTTGG